MTPVSTERIDWQGVVSSVQPRIRLMRSFDQRSHSYLGYALHLRGTIGSTEAEFRVGIGKAAQAKHAFRAGDELRGRSELVADERIEPVQYYKTSALVLLSRKEIGGPVSAPWQGVPPELPTYRKRGHRRLASRTFDSKCASCIWGCRMPVEIIIDQWKPGKKTHRFETFCYGPKSCALYRAGPTRKVTGRKGMTWEEEDWIDEDATAHRYMDE